MRDQSIATGAVDETETAVKNRGQSSRSIGARGRVLPTIGQQLVLYFVVASMDGYVSVPHWMPASCAMP